ncbi:hypothetical protein DUNSADRAFT_2752 [Dunaliella salina]|uniref:Uncharacterized protein n=1 Tax=Dunaliella salina TaxID=3046 RepID=A0ABQ7FVY3_DUNSA|nr:hypothetical protein DUNSADRAFT_2752 [Dunaliella salina]|eukprot:KAF5826545.1 hypothetical protein DUNSADRAFT_2752 [Dunaliella salina]
MKAQSERTPLFDPKLKSLFDDLINEKVELKAPLKHDKRFKRLIGSSLPKEQLCSYSKMSKKFHSFLVNRYTLLTEGGIYL